MPNFDNMHVSTIREFDGGLNIVTSELNLSTKYSTVENNMFYGISGSKQKRYGTKYFVDVKNYTTITESYVNADIIRDNNNRFYLIFDFADQNKNRLLRGHKLTITEPANLAGTYTVKQSDLIDFRIDVTDVVSQIQTVARVTITHNNRKPLGNRIIDGTYFLNRIVCVTNIGEVLAIDGEGDAIIIWNQDIANEVNVESQQFDPRGINEVCFCVFNGKLTIWNEYNKPLCVDLLQNIPCNFLVDEGTQSNALVPIAKYAIAINHYMVAGNTVEDDKVTRHPDRIYISMYDTIGTFNDGTQDPTENGGIFVDLGKIASTSMSEIRGLSRYRTQLIVGFDEVSVIGTLGNEIDAKTAADVEYKLHKPDFSDVISDYGCVGNRTYQTVLGDVCCLGYDGVGLFRKQVLSSLTTAAKLSTVIGPQLYTAFKDLTEEALNERIWSVFNPKEQQYMLFIPNNSEHGQTTETKCYVYTVPSTAAQSKATSGAWSLFTGWNFQWGCTSALNEVFFGNGTKIYILGNQDRPYYADFMDDPEYPADDETGISGLAISFDWEFGWQDFGNRVAKKTLRYVGITSTGTSQYTFGTWYDYIQDEDCEMHIDLVGGDANGWGAGRQLYGGSRRTSTEELFAYTAKFDLTKIRIYGTSKEDLKISGISLFFLNGNIRR